MSQHHQLQASPTFCASWCDTKGSTWYQLCGILAKSILPKSKQWDKCILGDILHGSWLRIPSESEGVKDVDWRLLL